MDRKSITRRNFMASCIAGASALVSARASARQNKRPNVVLIVSDDHGRETLGCYGNPVIRTPNLDALAAEGVRFTNAFCTTASCSASRSVILSGLYNHANGQYGHQHSYHHFISFRQSPTYKPSTPACRFPRPWLKGGLFPLPSADTLEGSKFPPARS